MERSDSSASEALEKTVMSIEFCKSYKAFISLIFEFERVRLNFTIDVRAGLSPGESRRSQNTRNRRGKISRLAMFEATGVNQSLISGKTQVG